jgi:cytochrome b
MVKVWDALLRVSRWVFVVCVAVAWFTRHGGDSLHEWSGYGALLIAGVRGVRAIVGRSKTRISYALGILIAATFLTAVSGWLHSSDRFWSVPWIGNAHAILAVGLAISIVFYGSGVLLARYRERRI